LRFEGIDLDKFLDGLNVHELEKVFELESIRRIKIGRQKTKGDEHETNKRDAGDYAKAEEAEAVGVRQELRSWQYSRIQEVRGENQRQTSALRSERDH
jgi:hypothetical protein